MACQPRRQGDSMSKSRREKAARRIACYLDTIGMCPQLDTNTYREHYRSLHEVYSALPIDLRREARRRGRRVINMVGLQRATPNLVPILLAQRGAVLSGIRRTKGVAQNAKAPLPHGRCSQTRFGLPGQFG
jgi:hypothetical protein